jgi:beta-lactamase regulating signal transducer with metallopeptidase domain
MPAFIEGLNHLGAQAMEVAWPMFWQSSLLIGVMLVVDWALRRRVRAAVRYALWCVVLLKLVLPPTLAFPTGPGWWLRHNTSNPHAAPPVLAKYGPELTAPSFQLSKVVLPVSPAPERLSVAGAVLAGTAGVSLVLLVWMLVRGRYAARVVRASLEPPVWVERMLHENRRALGLHRPLRLRLIDQAMSPAVCGLLRPVILVPRVLVERLSPAQLRSVLVHELVHLRRGDVWANCFQALLQAAYWWHPLLWLANARMRRVREEAVDDAVVRALRGDSEAYAATLFEVAKLALQRPLAALGLVGILESRSFLRQRIKRLLELRPARNTGLTFASVLCVLAFGAFALPMGQAPEQKAGAQINVKAVFLAVPEESLADFWSTLGFTNTLATNSAGILTPAQARKARAFAEENKGADLLNEASVTTLNGRQTQIQMVDLKTIVTNINPHALVPPGVPANGNGSNALYLATTLPFGPTLDVVPFARVDGFTLQLTVIANVSEFLGYYPPTNSPTVYVDGKKQRAELPLPRLRVRSVSNSAILWDGQTLLLAGSSAETITTHAKKRLLVLITPTLIDAAGNRLHTDGEWQKGPTPPR